MNTCCEFRNSEQDNKNYTSLTLSTHFTVSEKYKILESLINDFEKDKKIQDIKSNHHKQNINLKNEEYEDLRSKLINKFSSNFRSIGESYIFSDGDHYICNQCSHHYFNISQTKLALITKNSAETFLETNIKFLKSFLTKKDFSDNTKLNFFHEWYEEHKKYFLTDNYREKNLLLDQLLGLDENKYKSFINENLDEIIYFIIKCDNDNSLKLLISKFSNKEIKEIQNLKLILLGYIHDLSEGISLGITMESIETPTPDKVDVYNYQIPELNKKVKDVVIGQDNLINQLSTIFYIHQLRIDNSNVFNKKIIPLIVGETGTGKTLSLREFAKLINVPYIKISATNFTADGWSGADLSDFFKPYKNKDNFNYSIIHIDEFDKLSCGKCLDSKNEDFNELKQDRLLSFLEDDVFSTDECDSCEIKTENMQIVLSGSFQKYMNKKSEKSIGFGAEINNSKHDKNTINKAFLKEQNLIIPELLGRINTVIETRELEFDDYIKILKESKNNYLNFYENICSQIGIKIELNEDFYLDIATKAYNSEFGARDLNAYLFEYFNNLIQENTKPL